MDAVFHCLLEAILQINWRMFAAWESDEPKKD